jgi:hypothetical protein
LKRVKLALTEIKPEAPNACGFLAARSDFSPFSLRPQRYFNLEEVQLQKEQRYYDAGPKLLLKHNSIIPEAAFTRAPMCFTAAVYSLLFPDENVLKYLCGILNSSLMRFYCIFGINNQSMVTMNLNQYMIRHLPIVPYTQAGSQAGHIIDFVEMLSQEDGCQDTNSGDEREKYLAELDDEVFTLYRLEESAELITQKATEALKTFRKRKA